MEARRTTGSEHDVVVRAPGRTPAVGRRLANRMGRPSGQLDLSQLAVGKETDPLAIGREERIVGSLAAGNRAGIETIELSDVEPCRIRARKQQRPAAPRPARWPEAGSIPFAGSRRSARPRSLLKFVPVTPGHGYPETLPPRPLPEDSGRFFLPEGAFPVRGEAHGSSNPSLFRDDRRLQRSHEHEQDEG